MSAFTSAIYATEKLSAAFTIFLPRKHKVGHNLEHDEKNHKSTYVTLGSLESAKALAQEAVDKAKASLVDFGENAEFLRALVDYLITRNK